MAYSSGGLIEVTDFNTRVASVNQLWGTGSGSYGYGQSSTVATNSAGVVVPASDWATLIARMSSMQQHQFNNTTGIPSQPTSGSIITYLSAVDTAITSLQNNRFTGYAYSATTAYASTSNASSWISASTKTWTIAFASDNNARYFFNAGGTIQLVSNGNTLSPTTWNSFVNTGFTSFNIYAGSSLHNGTVGTYTRGTYLSTSGFYQLTSTPATYLSMTETGTGNTNYNNNRIDVNISYNGTGTITISLVLTDADPNTFGYQVTGTSVAYINIAYPETTYLTNTWGTPTTTNTVNNQA
jgi:hypothetical protein